MLKNINFHLHVFLWLFSVVWAKPDLTSISRPHLSQIITLDDAITVLDS
jgi:hypothetical protein